MKADDGLAASNRLHADLDLVPVSDRVEDQPVLNLELFSTSRTEPNRYRISTLIDAGDDAAKRINGRSHDEPGVSRLRYIHFRPGSDGLGRDG